jgi:hypothetical protein
LKYSEEVELIRRREGRQREKRRKAKESGGDEAREQEGRGIDPSGDGRQHHQESRSRMQADTITSRSRGNTNNKRRANTRNKDEHPKDRQRENNNTIRRKMSSKILSKSHKKTHLPPPGLAMRQCARPAPTEGERLLGGVALVDVSREQVRARELVAAVLAFVGSVAGVWGVLAFHAMSLWCRWTRWMVDGMGWGAEDRKEEDGEG